MYGSFYNVNFQTSIINIRPHSLSCSGSLPHTAVSESANHLKCHTRPNEWNILFCSLLYTIGWTRIVRLNVVWDHGVTNMSGGCKASLELECLAAHKRYDSLAQQHTRSINIWQKNKVYNSNQWIQTRHRAQTHSRRTRRWLAMFDTAFVSSLV